MGGYPAMGGFTVKYVSAGEMSDFEDVRERSSPSTVGYSRDTSTPEAREGSVV